MISKRYFSQFTCALLLFCLILAAPGCIGDKVSFPKKVKALPNTFKHDLRGLGEKVEKVQVYRSSDPLKPSELVWQINATCDVPAAHFVITVGQIPDGFEQIIPTPPEKLYLVPSEEYAITIHTNLTSVHAMGTYWTAE